MSSSTSQIGKNLVVIHYAPHVEAQAKWLIGLLQRLNGQGVSIEAGKRIQLGWSMIGFRATEPGVLLVTEPDFSRNPFSDTRDDVTVTLEVQARQNTLVRRLRVEPQAALFQDKIVMTQGCLRERHLYMHRTPNASKGDSGWFIGLREAGGGEPVLEAIYVFQLLQLQPALLSVLILPPGFLVLVDDGKVVEIVNPENEKVSGPLEG